MHKDFPNRANNWYFMFLETRISTKKKIQRKYFYFTHINKCNNIFDTFCITKFRSTFTKAGNRSKKEIYYKTTSLLLWRFNFQNLDLPITKNGFHFTQLGNL